MTSKIKVNILADGGDNSIITSDGAGSFTASSSLASSVQSVGALQNTPAFRAHLGSGQNVNSDTLTTIGFNIENFDTDNCYNTSTFRFTPTVAGKYYFFAGQRYTATGNYDTDLDLEIRKNGSGIARFRGINYFQDSRITQTIVEMNGSTDYVEATVYQTTGISLTIQPNNSDCFFGGYKLIGA
jgi:hypothetical protein